jgi:hypothetical protein
MNWEAIAADEFSRTGCDVHTSLASMHREMEKVASLWGTAGKGLVRGGEMLGRMGGSTVAGWGERLAQRGLTRVIANRGIAHSGFLAARAARESAAAAGAGKGALRAADVALGQRVSGLGRLAQAQKAEAANVAGLRGRVVDLNLAQGKMAPAFQPLPTYTPPVGAAKGSVTPLATPKAPAKVTVTDNRALATPPATSPAAAPPPGPATPPGTPSVPVTPKVDPSVADAMRRSMAPTMPGNFQMPMPAAPAAAAAPAGFGAQAKKWWGERAPWQQHAMVGAGAIGGYSLLTGGGGGTPRTVNHY